MCGEEVERSRIVREEKSAITQMLLPELPLAGGDEIFGACVGGGGKRCCRRMANVCERMKETVQTMLSYCLCGHCEVRSGTHMCLVYQLGACIQ